MPDIKGSNLEKKAKLLVKIQHTAIIFNIENCDIRSFFVTNTAQNTSKEK